MLSSVITYIDSKLSMNWMPSKKGLVDRIRINDTEIPAKYESNEWFHLEDFNEGFCYHRIIGEISSNSIPEEESVTCDEYEEKTYPLRLFLCKRKDYFDNNIYTSEKVLNELMSYIKDTNARDLCIELGADVVSIIPKTGNTNSYESFEAEYKGIKATPLDYVMVYVDYDVIIQGKVSCFESICL